MFQYHAETAFFSSAYFLRQITKYTFFFCFCIEYVCVLKGLFYTDPSMRPYSHQLLYICECVVVVVEEAGEDGLGGRESYVEEGSSLSQNVPLHTPSTSSLEFSALLKWKESALSQRRTIPKI